MEQFVVVIEEKCFGNSLNMIIAKHEIRQSDLAKEININKSSVSRVLKGTSECTFESVLSMVRYLVNHDSSLKEEEMMSSYMRELKSAANLKDGLEYADTHDMNKILGMLCKKAEAKVSRKNQLQEHINMYRVSIERKRQQDEPYVSKELFGKITQQDNKNNNEMKVFQLILELECFHQERNFYQILKYIPTAKKKLGKPTNNLQYSFKMRLNRIEQTVNLRYLCDFKQLERLAHEALENSIGKRFDAASYVNLGDSYIHDEDPTKAIGYLEKSIEIYNDIGLGFAANWMRSKVEFISLLRERKIDCIKN